MDLMFAELTEIPQRALDCLAEPVRPLPRQVPYLGMGSSYFASLAFKYMGINIHPELASEWVNYLAPDQKKPLGVILSQSGKSSEALWCRSMFDQYVAITNYPQNALGTAENVSDVVLMRAGEEQYSSSKTYINTLLVLFKGFGFDPAKAIELLVRNMKAYEEKGRKLADDVMAIRQARPIHGMYITGSGPNIATALEAALILSESTKLNFHGLPMAQYDHGPKETAKDSIVIQIVVRGTSYERTRSLSEKIRQAGAIVFEIDEPDAEEHFSVLTNIVPFNFMAYYLAKHLNVGETFTVGGKVTEVVA